MQINARVLVLLHLPAPQMQLEQSRTGGPRALGPYICLDGYLGAVWARGQVRRNIIAKH